MVEKLISYDSLPMLDPSMGSRPQEYECLKTIEETVMTDGHLEPKQLQDRFKDQCEELIQVNLRE